MAEEQPTATPLRRHSQISPSNQNRQLGPRQSQRLR